MCLDQQMHVDSFAKLSETLNCYIKKILYEMKYRNNCKNSCFLVIGENIYKAKPATT